MNDELEFEYPSQELFDSVVTQIQTLPVVWSEHTIGYFNRIEESHARETITDLIVRLKIELSEDYNEYLDELDDVPHLQTYICVVETEDQLTSLKILTVLRSKNGHPGRIMYGTSIFKIGNDLYLSGSPYAS
jgi:hypothetical protein